MATSRSVRYGTPFLLALLLATSLQAISFGQSLTSRTYDITSGTSIVDATNYTLSGTATLNPAFAVDYVIVGGGGGGGGASIDNANGTGGGGAGGVRSFLNTGTAVSYQIGPQGSGQIFSGTLPWQVTGTSIMPRFSVVVGAGGTGGTKFAEIGTQGGNGRNSSFLGQTAFGGGGGGRPYATGSSGGSGGGGGRRLSVYSISGSSVTYSGSGGSAYGGGGYAGGAAANTLSSTIAAGGGGGGAAGIGSPGLSGSSYGSGSGGRGGNGLLLSISGSNRFYGGGGGGGGLLAGGTGGSGIGGNGAATGNGGNGASNTGSGGGGTNDGDGGNGGDGIVIVRYRGSQAATGGTISVGTGSAAGYTIHTFTTTGSSVLDFTAMPAGRLGSVTLAGNLSGSGGLAVGGLGTITLSGSNSYTGGTIVNGGRLVGTTDSLKGRITNNGNSIVEFNQHFDGIFSGTVAGSGRLVKSGTGTLTISGSIGTNGGISVDGGRLVGTATTLSTPTMYSNVASVRIGAGASLEFSQAATGTFFGSTDGAGSIVKSGGGTLVAARPLGNTGGLTVTAGRLVGSSFTLRGSIANSGTVEFAQAVSGTFAGTLSGSGAVVKSGLGMLVLSTTTSMLGPITVGAGMLATAGRELLPNSATVNVTSGSAMFRLGGDETLAAVTGSGVVDLSKWQLTLLDAGSNAFTGRMWGVGGLTKAGDGVFTLGGTNGFMGPTNVNGGTLVLAGSTSLSPFTTLTLGTGATLQRNGTVRVFSFNNLGGTVTGTGQILTSATSRTSGTLSAPLTNVTGSNGYSVGLLKTGSGTLFVSASNTFTGGVKVESGTMRLTGSGGFAAGNPLEVSQGAVLDLGGRSQSFSTLLGDGSVAIGSGTLTVSATSSSTYRGMISGTAFVKTGSSSMNLTGTSTVARSTVDSGLMSVNGTLLGDVAIAAGGKLGGSGVITGDVLVGGTHAPGNSPGISTINGNLSYQPGATVVWEMAGNTDSQSLLTPVFDQTVVNGDLAFSGSTSLILSFFDNDPESTWASNIDWSDTFWDDDHSWTIYDVSGTTTGFTNLSLLQESWLDNADPTQQAFATIRPSASFSLVLFGNDVRLAYTVPEPSSIILATLGIVAACGLRRLRGRHTIDG